MYTRNVSWLRASRIDALSGRVAARDDHRGRQAPRQLLGVARPAQDGDRPRAERLLDDLARPRERPVFDPLDDAQRRGPTVGSPRASRSSVARRNEVGIAATMSVGPVGGFRAFGRDPDRVRNANTWQMPLVDRASAAKSRA